MILDEIVKKKYEQIEEEKKQLPLETLLKQLSEAPLSATRDFYGAIKRDDKMSIIAEIKKASPSKGVIKEDFDPKKIALEYEKVDIQAISVLTEKNFFKGDDRYISVVKSSAKKSILRKDFIIDIWQIYQARLIGADAILLIASILSKEQLKEYVDVAKSVNLQCLVEASSEEDLDKALKSGTSIIGINNRDLKTFQVDINRTKELMKNVPSNMAKVSESGIKASEDLKHLEMLGIDAVLIGETFMRAESIEEKVKELRG